MPVPLQDFLMTLHVKHLFVLLLLLSDSPPTHNLSPASFPCQDEKFCVCSGSDRLKLSVTCRNVKMSRLAPSVFDNSRSNATEEFRLTVRVKDINNGVALSRARFPASAPRGYRAILIENACVSRIEPGFFTYLLANVTPPTTSKTTAASPEEPAIVNDKLWRVSITYNPCLTKLEAYTFNRLPRLVIIDMQANNLNSIEPFAFQNLPVLDSLILSQNRIRIIQNNTFQGLSSLSSLDLSHNELVRISAEAFRSLNNLRLLNLNSNRLVQLPPGLFSNLYLGTLDLSANRLRAFTRRHVLGTTRESLRRLYLNANHLTEFGESVMDLDNANPENVNIRLDNNPFHCVCSFSWMKKREVFISQDSIV